MKMSEKVFKIFEEFYRSTVESASDEDVIFIMKAVNNAAKQKLAEKNENHIDPYNAKIVRDFFEDFLCTASNDDAIYLIEVIKSACKKINEDPESVAKFVIAKKKEAAKHAKKD